MASRQNIVDYICDQMSGAGTVTARKMFGEYGVYCDGTFIGVICNDTLFLKPTDAAKQSAPDVPLAPAYEGARASLCIPDHMIEDPPKLAELTRLTRDNLPSK